VVEGGRESKGICKSKCVCLIDGRGLGGWLRGGLGSQSLLEVLRLTGSRCVLFLVVLVVYYTSHS
jgi:hypothetical protein